METLLAVGIGAAILVLLATLLFIALGPKAGDGAAGEAPIVPVPVDEETAAGMPAKILMSTGMFIFTLLFMTAYWLTEPQRHITAAEVQHHHAIERGAHSYALYCAQCHGDTGRGRTAPPLTLDSFLQRHPWDLTDNTQRQQAEAFVYNTIYYGWPPAYRGIQPVMPNWGEGSGGPLNYEQVNELVTFVLDPDTHKWDEVRRLVEEAGGLPPLEGAPEDATPAEQGAVVYINRGCGSCHVHEALRARGATGTIAPDLTNFHQQPQIAGVVPNDEENLRRWLADPPAVKPGTAMPNLGLTEEEIDVLVAFLLQQ